MSLPSKIYALESFKEEFNFLWKKSVQALFPRLILENENLFSKKIDWNYLLTCASILSHSDIARHQDAALRIAQNCLSNKETTEIQKAASAVILNKLTNKQALELALQRELISKDFTKQIPLPLIIEQTRRDTQQIVITSSNKEFYLNKFQKLFYDKVKQVDHISASAPTSAGKSFILNLSVLENLHGNNPINIVYVVPTRALISQVERDLSEAILEHNLDGVYISSVPQLPKEIGSSKSKIFIFTQERLHWLLSDNPDFKVDFLVIDEAQKIGDGGRGVLLQQKIEELVKRLPDLRVLFCSAHTENPEILLSGLGANASTQSIRTDYVTVNQNLLWASQVKGKPKEWVIDLCIDDNKLEIGKVVLQSSLKDSQKLPVFASLLGSPDGGNMIYVNGQAAAEDAADYLYDLLGPKDTVIDKEIDNLIELAQKVIHPQYALCKVLKKGVAFHYGNMPQVVKNEIETLFVAGKIKYLVCTSTLLEGVNLPARSIFVRKPKRGNSAPMSDDDFWNLAGRVGRLKHEFQGNIICIDPSEWNPPTEKKRFTMTRAVNEISKNTVAFLEYLKKGTPRAEINDQFEYILSYFYSKFLKEGTLKGVVDDPAFINELEEELGEVKLNIDIPPEIIYRNPGISPLAQHELLESFRKYDGKVEDLIPVFPKENDAAEEHYKKIIERMSDTLTGDPKEGYAFARAILVVNWIRGYPLGRIINLNLKYWKKKDPNISLAKVIRDTMRDIEEYVRFKFAKYSACYTDVLRFYLENEHKNLVKEVPALNMWIEFGVSQVTQMSLIQLGFTRHTAIELSEYAEGPNLDIDQCIKWILGHDASTFEIPESMKNEYRDIKKKLKAR